MPKPRLTSPDRSTRHLHDKATRLAARHAHLHDAAPFAYMQGWPLEIRPTITWNALPLGAGKSGSVTALSDKHRNARLCRELGRILHREGHAYACLWARGISPHHGPHIHMALYWPLPVEMLIAVLERLTGAPCTTPIRRRGKIIAQGAYGTWQINQNRSRDQATSAARWVGYLDTQRQRHMQSTMLEGLEVGFSKTLGFKAIAPYRARLSAYRAAHHWPVHGA